MATREFADISSAKQREGDFDAAEYRAAGAVIVGIKATEGSTFVNPWHHAWVAAAHRSHLGVMHYHFYSPDTSSPEAQADHFWRTIDRFVGPFDYIVCDYERASVHGHEADCVNVHRFTNRIHHWTRFDPITYSYRAFLQARGAAMVPGRRRVWLADYSSSPSWVPPGCSVFARQHTDGQFGPGPHSLRGVSGTCDVSTLNLATYRHLVANLRHDHRWQR